MSGSATLAEQAREALRTLIGDGPLRLIADAEPADAGGRLLRHVYRADRLLAADLARQGWVRALPIPPNLAEREVIDRAVAEARAAARGIWALDVGGVSLSVDKVKEVVTLANTGSAPLDISGWWLVSLRGKQSYRFPTKTTITPGETLQVVSGGDPGHASIPAAQRLEQHQTRPSRTASHRRAHRRRLGRPRFALGDAAVRAARRWSLARGRKLAVRDSGGSPQPERP